MALALRELQRELVNILSPKIERAAREAQLLLMAHLQKDELWLITNQNAEIAECERLFEWAKRRAENEPLEYIVSRVSFYSEEFYIQKGALIPRPETELLIDEVKKFAPDRESRFRFVEVGVGSGVISIMLALHYPNATFIAVDISEAALDVAKINLERFGLTHRVELRLGSLLEEVDEQIDYLVSNPPYIALDAPLESNLSYEPQNALFGGEIGDEIIKRLLDEVLKRKIRLFSCEMGYDQKDKIQNYLDSTVYESLTFYKDLSQFDRGFTLKV